MHHFFFLTEEEKGALLFRSRYSYRICSPWIIALTSSDAQKSPVTLNSCFIIAVIADCFLSEIAIFTFRNC